MDERLRRSSGPDCNVSGDDQPELWSGLKAMTARKRA